MTLSPNIFIENFERTEHSDYLHGVIGRSLIVATRFDNSCVNLATAINFKSSCILFYTQKTNEEFDDFVDKLILKDKSLNDSIKSLNFHSGISTTLHDARKARNEIAHSLTKSLDGCLDTKINAKEFIQKTKNHITTITKGDIIISIFISIFNREPMPNNAYLEKYINEVNEWVTAE